ncbi:MAG: STAS domain-containing protein [Solirubrobacteraceae bacterium]
MSTDLRFGQLQVQDDAQSTGHTLSLSGELDLASAAELEAAIVRLCRDGAQRIVLDLEALTFIDSTGLRAILYAIEMCAAQGCGFHITPGPVQVQRLFAVAGVLDSLPFVAVERASPQQDERRPA